MYFELAYNTVVYGSLLAIICIGYNFAYGFAKVINFAHPDIMIFGGGYLVLYLITGFPNILSQYIVISLVLLSIFVVVFFYSSNKIIIKSVIAIAISSLLILIITFSGNYSFWSSFFIAIPLTSLFAVSVYIVGYYPLLKRNAPRNSILLSALGFSIAIESLMLILFGSSRKSFSNGILPDFLYFTKTNTSGYISLSNDFNILKYDIAIVFVFLLIVLFLFVFLKKTNWGRTIIGASENHLAARACGIPVYKILGVAFIIGGILASIAGTLLIIRTKSLYPTAGFSIGIIAFMACVLGGIGNIKGTIISAFIVSFIISFTPIFDFNVLFNQIFPDSITNALPSLKLSDWSYGIVYLIVIIVIIFKPKGLFTKQ